MYNQRYTNINTQPAISEHEYMNIDVLLTDFDVVFESVCGTRSLPGPRPDPPRGV